MICGNFDLKNTVSNQLNGITDGFKDLMGMSSAVPPVP